MKSYAGWQIFVVYKIANVSWWTSVHIEQIQFASSPQPFQWYFGFSLKFIFAIRKYARRLCDQNPHYNQKEIPKLRCILGV